MYAKAFCISTSSVAARQLPLKGKPFQGKKHGNFYQNYRAFMEKVLRFDRKRLKGVHRLFGGAFPFWGVQTAKGVQSERIGVSRQTGN